MLLLQDALKVTRPMRGNRRDRRRVLNTYLNVRTAFLWASLSLLPFVLTVTVECLFEREGVTT